MDRAVWLTNCRESNEWENGSIAPDWYRVGSGNVNTTAMIRMARQFNMIRGKLNEGTVNGND